MSTRLSGPSARRVCRLLTPGIPRTHWVAR
jgi:hypothetical protein